MRIARSLSGPFLSNPASSSRDAVRRCHGGWSRLRTNAQEDIRAGGRTRHLSTATSFHGQDEADITQEPSLATTFRAKNHNTGSKIFTFAPARLTHADYVDMSLHATYTARWQRHKVVPFDIRAGGAFRARRFPPGTRGFFYYYHDPTTPPLAGELRFRVTRDRDPSLFASGHDLLGDNGIPWRISLIQIASRKTFESIKDTLLEDGLVSEAVIAKASTQSVRSEEHTSELHHSGEARMPSSA